MRSGDYSHALENYRQGVSIRSTLLGNTNTPLIRTHLAADYTGLARAMSATGDLSEALDYSKKAAEILEQLSSSDPNNATLQEYLGEADDRVASILLKLHQFASSLGYYNKSLSVFVKLSRADPANSLARDNAGLAEVAIGDMLIEQKQMGAAIPHVRNAIANFESSAHKTSYEVAGQASAYDAMGKAFFGLAERDLNVRQKSENLQRSKVWLEKSLNMFRQEPSLNSVDPLGGDITQQSVMQELRQCEESLARLQPR
jgi:tetratricopeptide (TPR) repeat protein